MLNIPSISQNQQTQSEKNNHAHESVHQRMQLFP
jgi:hypothetical protein